MSQTLQLMQSVRPQDLQQSSTSQPQNASLAPKEPGKIEFRSRHLAEQGDRMQTDAHEGINALNSSQASTRMGGLSSTVIDDAGGIAEDEDIDMQRVRLWELCWVCTCCSSYCRSHAEWSSSGTTELMAKDSIS